MAYEPRPNLIRAWRLRSRGQSEEVIAAVIAGPDTTFPGEVRAGEFLAFTEYALQTNHHRTVRDGQDVLVSLPEPGSAMRRGRLWNDLESATAWLETERRRLLLEGWIELPLDPLQDPD